MTLVLITAPTTEPVTIDEAKAHLRVDGSDDDTLIEGLITAARAHLDGRDGWLGRALITQTWELRLDAFPAEIRLPLPPLVSVSSIKYDDENGGEQTLSAALYQVVTGEPARIVPAYGQSWPATYPMPHAVRVRFTAGYGAAASVPEPIKSAIKLMIGTLYRDRETSAVGNAIAELPAIGFLLAPYRVWMIG